MQPQTGTTRKTYLLIGTFFLVSVFVWWLFLSPVLLRLPHDFSFEADVVSTDNFFDVDRGDYSGQIFSKTDYRYTTLSAQSKTAIINNSFTVKTPYDDLIFSTERVYGINRYTGEHLTGVGDRDRDGYLFAPSRLEPGQSFVYWHVNYDGPAVMNFVQSEDINGLTVYKYQSNYQGVTIDQTNDLDWLPNVGESWGVRLDPHLEIWVEPTTGYLVKYRDLTTAYYYDLQTGEQLHPWNQFSNTFASSSVQANVEAAKVLKAKYVSVRWYIPSLLILLTLAFFLRGFGIIDKITRFLTIKKSSLIGGISTILIATSVLLGWATNQPGLRSLGAGPEIMNPLTAVCFVILGIILILWGIKRQHSIIISLAAALGIIAIVQYFSSLDVMEWAPDLMLFGDQIMQQAIPSRMSQFAALAFILISLVSLTHRTKFFHNLHTREILTSIVFLFSVLGLISFLFGSLKIVTIPEFFHTSLYTILLLCLTSVLFYKLTDSKKYHTISTKNWLSISGVIFIAISITLIAASVVDNTAQKEAENVFYDQVDIITRAITSRSEIYIQTLQGARGLLNASDSVERDEWKSYVDALEIEKNYPGIQGIGYAIFIQPEDLDQHISDIQSQGFPDYTIRPEGNRDIYSSIIYLEPFDIRNQQAFGFDMYQESTRRSAMDQARDNALPSLSGPIILVQEIDDDIQTGFLVYLPYYGRQAAPETVVERRSDIIGFVYSPFRARNFIEGVLSNTPVIDHIYLRITDGVEGYDSLIIYDSIPPNTMNNPSTYTTSQTVYIAGRPWTLTFQGDGSFSQNVYSVFVFPIIIGVGLLVSILIALTFYTLASSREKALEYAESITRDLRSANEQAERKAVQLAEKNKEIEKRSEELARLNQLMVGREQKMIEMKQQLQQNSKSTDHV